MDPRSYFTASFFFLSIESGVKKNKDDNTKKGPNG